MKTHLPPIASLIITNKCNLHCAHCYTDANVLKYKELETKDWKSTIDILAALPVFEVYIGGGEPMLRPDFVELLKHAVSCGLSVTTSTNGSFVSPETVAGIPNSVFIQVSIDGPKPVHDGIRGSGSFDSAMRSVEILRKFEHKVSIATVANKLNHRVFRRFFETTIRSLDISLWHVLRMQPVGRGGDNYDDLGLSNEEWVEVVKGLRRIRASGFAISIDSSFDLEGVEELHPEDAWFYWRDHGADLCIWPDGDVTPSDLCLPPKWTIGNMQNISNEKALREMIVSSETLARLNDAQMSVGGKCLRCKANDTCRGGSRIVALTLAGDIAMPDPFCPHDPPYYEYQ